MSTWRCDYIFPPLSPGQAENLQPYFSAVGMLLHNRIEEIQDPSYQSNALVWQLAGIESIFMGEGTYGRFAGGGDLSFPTWSCTFEVKERLQFVTGELQTLNGVDQAVDLASPLQPTVSDVADNAFSIVDPTTIPGIVSLWRPDGTVTLASDAQHVAQVNDLVGTNHQIQATGANQPLLVPAAVTDAAGNKKAVLRFDGTASFMVATVSALANDGGKSIVCLARLSDTAKRSSIVAQTLSADTGTHSMAIEANTQGTTGAKFGLFADGSAYDAIGPTDTNWHVLAMTTTATTNLSSITSSTTLQVDNSAPQTLTLRAGAGTWAGMSTANQIVLGAIPGIAGTFAACDLGPVLVFSGALTTSQLTTAAAYLKQWVGLS
jgi:hypothetical protein